MPKQERITYLLSKLYNGNINRSELDELQMFFNNKIESDLYFNNSLDSINQTIPLIRKKQVLPCGIPLNSTQKLEN